MLLVFFFAEFAQSNKAIIVLMIRLSSIIIHLKLEVLSGEFKYINNVDVLKVHAIEKQ